MGAISARLAELGIELPAVAAPVGAGIGAAVGYLIDRARR